MADPKPKYWSVTEAACETGWSENQLYALPLDGTMKVERGRRVKFHIELFTEFTRLNDKASQDTFYETIVFKIRRAS